jgi:hypothetical protein
LDLFEEKPFFLIEINLLYTFNNIIWKKKKSQFYIFKNNYINNAILIFKRKKNKLFINFYKFRKNEIKIR